jgi:hypothetical protein
MLPLALKVVWLVLAALGPSYPFLLIALMFDLLQGVPATWIVFTPFASTIGTYWASILYCVAVTVLEVTFCLGTFPVLPRAPSR